MTNEPTSGPPASGLQSDESESLGKSESLTQRIILRDMILGCTIGFMPEERARRQRLRINLEIDVESSPAFSDEINDTLNYSGVVRRVRELCAACSHRLLETLADDLAAACFVYANVTRTKVRIEKLDRYADVGSIGVEIVRQRNPE